MEVMERQAFIMKIEELSRRNDSLESENKELRELLKLAAEDTKGLFSANESEYNKHHDYSPPAACIYCKNYSQDGCVGSKPECVWRYADKLKRFGIED